MYARYLPSVAVVALSLALGSGAPLAAQTVILDDEWCEESWGDSRSERYCEVREFDLAARDLIRIDAEPNGSIRVEGWDRNEISLRARVSAWSRRGNPEEMTRDIRIETGETITAEGPETERRESWSVSFRLMVPRNSNLDLESFNGGIRVQGVRGRMELEAMNGGINLEDVGGDVKGHTTNGGVTVRLSGDEWDGAGLDLRTTNGGVNLVLPETFRADLETGTVNGSFHTDFPITLRGRLRSNRIQTQLNGGGPPVHVSTTNGSVKIRAR